VLETFLAVQLGEAGEGVSSPDLNWEVLMFLVLETFLAVKLGEAGEDVTSPDLNWEDLGCRDKGS
jgi:hypothetical protein